MIIDEENIRVQYESTAESPIVAGDVLPFPYRFTEKEQLNAVLLDGTKLTYNQDYTVGETSITLSVDIPIGDTVTIYRSTPLDQGSEFPQEAKFNSKKIEDALDKLTMQNQEQREALGRALKLPLTASTDLSDLALPNPDPNKSVKWNADGTALVNTDFDPDLALALTENFKNQAQQAAVEAENQRNVATEQAQIATEQAQIATEQATQQAGIATQQAGIATEKAVEATSAVEEFAGITNVPYTMFESRYFEIKLDNASWLRADTGAYWAKAAYQEQYEAVQVEQNAEIADGEVVTLPIGKEYVKKGLSVKLSTETFTDYDFVLNITDETFRLPLKSKLASGKAVVGNGMTLGLTDGTSNVGFLSTTDAANAGHLIAKSSLFGVALGTSVTGANYNSDAKGYGVTTDPTKSGIETSDSDLYLYYYIGATVQDADLINAGAFQEQLADKVDLSNTQWATNACMPDYTAGVNRVAGTYTENVDGVLMAYTTGTSGESRWDVTIARTKYYFYQHYTGADYAHSTNGFFPIPKNTTYVLGRGGSCLVKFFPLKGAN